MHAHTHRGIYRYKHTQDNLPKQSIIALTLHKTDRNDFHEFCSPPERDTFHQIRRRTKPFPAFSSPLPVSCPWRRHFEHTCMHIAKYTQRRVKSPNFRRATHELFIAGATSSQVHSGQKHPSCWVWFDDGIRRRRAEETLLALLMEVID